MSDKELDPIYTITRSEYRALLVQSRRYEYVRDHGEQFIGADRGLGAEWTYGEELDQAIDAAIRNSGGAA